MSSLDKLTIKGFKSIQELVDFELTNLNVFIGGNGAGKSNFIEFFRMISAMMKLDGLKEFIAGNADTYLFGGPKLTKSISIKMVFGENGYDFELAPTEDGFFLINN
ncbi:MAG: AAA family ATPase, partial [Desulfamplus sp.]|nr:AAA family ATPase [Desulfamplus sp.]